MPVKRYEVDGNPYDVSDAKEQEFLSKFNDAVLIGVLDEETNEVVEQNEVDVSPDFPTSAAADADVVQPMTASQAGYVELENTESQSVDTSLDSPDLDNEDFTLEQFKLMTPKEKNALSYSDRQRLPRELYREKQSKDNIDFIDFSSEDFNKLENEEKVKLKEIAGKKIIEDYNSKGIIDFKVSDEELDNKAKGLLKEKNKPGLIKSYAAQTARGFSNFAKGTIDFLDMTKFSILEAGLEVFGDGYEGTADDKEAIMRVVKSGTIGPMGSPRSLDFQTFTEKLDPYIRKYENQNIVDDIAEGNYLLAGERAVGASLESLPSIVAAGLGLGGLIVLGGSSAGGKFEEEFEKDPSINTGILVSNALITGVIEATLELATRGVLKRAGILSNQGNAKAAKDLIRGGSESLIKGLGINTTSEAGSEALTRTSTLLLDAAMLPGRDFDLGRDWKLIAEDAIVGSVFGISGTGVGAVKNRNVDAVQAAEYVLMPDQVKNVVEESGKKISELYKDKASAEPEGVALIDEAIELETARILNIKKQNSRALNDMTPNEVRSYANNKSKINELKSTINKSGQKDVVKKLAEDKLKTLQEVNKTLFKESSDRRVERNIQSVEKIAKGVEGLTFKPLENSEAVSEFIKENNIDIDNKKASEEQGFIYQNPETGAQTIIINKDVSKKQKAVNIAGHEFLHAVLFNTVKGSPETQVALGESLNNYINNIDVSKINNSEFAKRLEQYKDSDKATQSEEVLTLFSDALTSGDIKFNENVFTIVGDVIRRTLQGIGVKVKFNKGRDVYNFVKDYNNSIIKGKLTKTQEKATAEGVEGELVKPKVKTTDETIVKESRILSPNAEFLRDELTNEELVASVKSKATEDVFSVAQAIVEKNFGLIRDSNVLTFDKSNPAQINAVKEILEEQILGVFEGSGRGKYSARKTGLFNAYESTKEDGASPSTYLLGVIKTRKPEIDIALKERTIKSEGDSIDSDQAKQVVDRSTKTSATVDKLAKKPTETTKFKSNYISPGFKESLDTSKSEKEAIENKISSTVKESFKDRKVSRFKETGKIPQKLAQLYADMFGIKTTSALIEKQRNLQKLDQEGAVRARQFLIDNAASDFARLPRSKDDTNKATGILQTKIGKVLYNKAGELTGSLKTYTDIIKGKNITLEGYDGKQYEFNQLDSEGNKKPIYRDAQHIKAALDFHIRNRALETLIPEQGKRIQAGAKFSKKQVNTINEFIENQSFVKTSEELAAENKMWRFISKTLNIETISSKEPKDVEAMKQWFVNNLAPKMPKSFITQGTFANAGTSAPKRNFFLTSRQAIDDLFNGVSFADKDIDIAEAVSRKTYVTGGASGVVSKKFLKEFNSKEFKQAQERKLKGLKKIFKVFEGMIQEDPNNAKFIISLLSSTSQGMGHFVRTSAPIKFYSKNLEGGIVEEHTMPASLVAKYLFKSAVNGTVDNDFVNIENNYFQTRCFR